MTEIENPYSEILQNAAEQLNANHETLFGDLPEGVDMRRRTESNEILPLNANDLVRLFQDYISAEKTLSITPFVPVGAFYSLAGRLREYTRNIETRIGAMARFAEEGSRVNHEIRDQLSEIEENAHDYQNTIEEHQNNAAESDACISALTNQLASFAVESIHKDEIINRLENTNDALQIENDYLALDKVAFTEASTAKDELVKQSQKELIISLAQIESLALEVVRLKAGDTTVEVVQLTVDQLVDDEGKAQEATPW